MSKRLERKWFEQLLEQGEMSSNRLPVTLRNKAVFDSLEASHILIKERRGHGFVYRIKDEDSYISFLQNRFPDGKRVNGTSPADYPTNPSPLQPTEPAGTGAVLVRGWARAWVNEQPVDLAYFTRHFGFFGGRVTRLESDRLCIVENYDAFLQAEKLLGQKWLYLHGYGRISTDTAKALQAREVCFLPDYDFAGLDAYLRLKQAVPQTRLYLPENFQDLHEKYAVDLPPGAAPLKAVCQSDLPEVMQVRELLEETGSFLQQQALFIHLGPTNGTRD